MPRKLCEREGCTKGAVSGGTPHCVAHGGVKRCQKEDRTKSARGDTDFLEWTDRGDTDFCIAHGRGRRCQHAGCPKSAASVGTPHCVAHGGGRRCQEEDCTKSARGDTGFLEWTD